ncbi:MAG: protein kinase [Myxococcales bacterium]|nr:protein kinase [Myxococcales bacterium]
MHDDRAGSTLGFRRLLDGAGRAIAEETSADEAFSLGARLTEVDTTPPPDAVPLIRLAEQGEDGDFELRGTIGQGNMGRVHVAWQRSVGREVAIKVPRGGDGHGSRIEALLREARITGRLEHPNIVPMHGLGRTPEGATVMVAKRVEGVSWRAIADGAAPMPERFAGTDPIEGHLKVLIAVCDAVDFAHQKGVLHRDLKLDNVMIGAFGEVYVLDWGLAVALEDDGTGHLPLAAAVVDVAGTPGYMAPEMAFGEGHRLGPTSDVYCLGALLHRLLVGAPRHTGRTLAQVLLAARKSIPFDYSAHDVPPELALVCARATAADPAARYPDVAALRRALIESLDHRASSRLVAEAERARAAMHAAHEQNQLELLDRRFGAARFALEHALEIWPDNPEARRALDALLLDRAEVALAAGRPGYAEQLLAAAQGVDFGPRKAEVAARIARETERQSRLTALSRDLDLGLYSRRRGLLLLGMTATWFVNGVRRTVSPPSIERLLFDQIWVAAALALVVYAARRWLWSTRVNRQLVLALAGIIASDTGFRIAGRHHGFDVLTITSLELWGEFVGLLFAALLVDIRLLASAAIFAAGAAVSLVWVEHAFMIKSTTVLLGMGLTGLIWMRRPMLAPDEYAAP